MNLRFPVEEQYQEYFIERFPFHMVPPDVAGESTQQKHRRFDKMSEWCEIFVGPRHAITHTSVESICNAGALYSYGHTNFVFHREADAVAFRLMFDAAPATETTF